MGKRITLRRADGSVIRVYAGRAKQLSDNFMLGQAVRVPGVGTWPDWPWDEQLPKSVGPDGVDAFSGCRAGVETVEPPAPSLVDVKAALKVQVDATAENLRLSYITPGAGQALEYREVADEAQRYAADPSGDFPLLQASVDAGEAGDIASAAALVAARHDAWISVGAAIRAARIAGKRAIDAASSAADAHAAYEGIEWP